MSILAELRKRKPAQEDFQGLDTLMSDADAIKAEEMIIEGKEPIPELSVDVAGLKEFKPQETMDRDLRSAIIDAFVGGVPSLLGMIGGGSAPYNTMNLEKGSEYLKKRAQDEANQKLVQLKSVDGTPYYEKAKYAVGMEPYIKPDKVSLGSGLGGKSYKPSQFIDTETGRVFQGMFSGGQLVDIDSGRIINTEGIMNYEPPKFKETENVRGDKGYYRINPVTLKKEFVLGSEGLGTTYNVATKGQAENIEKAQAQSQKDVYELERQVARLGQATDALRTSKDPRVISGSIYTLARELEDKGVLTESDYQKLTGQDLLSFKAQLKHLIDIRAYGEAAEYAKTYIKAAEQIRAVKQADIDSIRGSIPRGGPRSKDKAPALEKAPKPPASNKNKAKFIELEKAARKRIKDPALLKKFLEQKKSELGL